MKWIKIFLGLLIFEGFMACGSQYSIPKSGSSYLKEMYAFQQALNAEFKNEKTSPLDSVGLAHFKGLDFFPLDSQYRIKARFVKNMQPEVFEMPTTTKRKAKYIKYGDAYFSIHETLCHLEIYQNLQLQKNPEYKDYLFAPFGDQTNGMETYAGGRYLDLHLPIQADSIILDFNKAYNPYCAYSHRYSCPIIPYQNILPVHIKAGVKKFIHD